MCVYMCRYVYSVYVIHVGNYCLGAVEHDVTSALCTTTPVSNPCTYDIRYSMTVYNKQFLHLSFMTVMNIIKRPSPLLQ